MDLSNLRKTNTESSALTESDKTKMKEDKDKQPPKNIMETNTWKKGSSGISSMWKNYLAILDKYFRNYSRVEQERLITTMCTVVTIGCATVLVTLFYPFIPSLIRLFAVPAILLGSWFVATKVVAPILITQFDDRLNKD